MVSFSQWYNEEADIPQLIDGEWVDLETGIPFSAWAKSQGRNENKVRQSISAAGQDYRKYAKALGGKALTGTIKQKEWAEKIRFNILKQLPQASQEMLVTHEAFQSSKFWIEMRDISAQRLSDFAVKVFSATRALNTLARKIEEAFKYEANHIYQPLHEKWIAANRSYEQALQGDLDKIDDIKVTDIINEANSYTDEIAQAKEIWQTNQKNKKIANADRDLEQKRINVLKLTGNESALDIIEKCRLFLKAKNNMSEAQAMALSAFDSIGDFSLIHNYQSINAANILSIIDAMIEAMQPTVTSDAMARVLTEKYPVQQSEVGDNTATPASATHKITMGRTNKVKTAKGTKIDTQFALVDGKYLIASHTATGAENPKYPQDLQPRDRKRESSIAWVQKTAKDLDPESLGRTGRADTGAPIVGEDLIVESGNGRTMAIMLAYKEGTADEYRQWLIENADLFGFTEQQVERYKQPVLVRIRKTPVDRATFAVEANQDDKLSFTATERAKSDAKRIDDRLIQLFSPSDDGDLLAASNREFIRGFMASLGDTEAAQYTDSSGKPTQALLTRIKAAIFSKAYDDDRLLEMMADHSKPELQNMLNALSMAAPKFVEARGVSLGDTQELAEKLVDGVEASIDDQVKNAIIDATNMIITAKRNNQSITEFVTQQGLFDDMDDATAQLAVFIATHARSAKKMAEYFKAMAQAIEDEKVKGQTLDMFGEPEPLDLKTILDFANSVVNPDAPATLDKPSPSTDYSPDNPFAPYANDDPEVKQNADDWESRKPLTEQRLADMNALAESMGYVTYIESRHANMGVFQAEKEAGNRHVSIDGRFINNDADSVKETARDFTLEMQENGEPEDYFYTNDLQAALTKGNEWLDDASSKVSQETPSPLQPILDSLNNGADPLSIDLESLGRLAEDEPDSPLLDQIDQQLGKALRAAGVALADKVA